MYYINIYIVLGAHACMRASHQAGPDLFFAPGHGTATTRPSHPPPAQTNSRVPHPPTQSTQSVFLSVWGLKY